MVRQDFLKCTAGDGSLQAKWYSGIKSQIIRQLFHKAILNEEKLDWSADERSS